MALALPLPQICHAGSDIPLYQARIVNTYPHDSNAFTQGLEIFQGNLYEGTGRNGQSSLRQVDLESGSITRRVNLNERYFGEGITIVGDKVYQLTWRSHTAFIYDLASFKVQGSFYLPGEGWGITHDDRYLIVSDGTAFLRFLDPDTHQEVKRVQVSDDTGPLQRLNELEYINGEVWANVWYQDYIVRINPDTGQVTGRVDLSSLYPHPSNGDDVLNGIAWDSEHQRLFVTGKLWPMLYEIKLVE